MTQCETLEFWSKYNLKLCSSFKSRVCALRLLFCYWENKMWVTGKSRKIHNFCSVFSLGTPSRLEFSAVLSCWNVCLALSCNYGVDCVNDGDIVLNCWFPKLVCVLISSMYLFNCILQVDGKVSVNGENFNGVEEKDKECTTVIFTQSPSRSLKFDGVASGDRPPMELKKDPTSVELSLQRPATQSVHREPTVRATRTNQPYFLCQFSVSWCI